jgi:hypothetical protein
LCAYLGMFCTYTIIHMEEYSFEFLTDLHKELNHRQCRWVTMVKISNLFLCLHRLQYSGQSTKVKHLQLMLRYICDIFVVFSSNLVYISAQTLWSGYVTHICGA